MVSKLIGDRISFLYNTTIDDVTVYSCDPNFEQENIMGRFFHQDESLLSDDDFDDSFDDSIADESEITDKIHEESKDDHENELMKLNVF